ncbi:MAG: prepilin-type N-terminal cleavage/methylation domain-containing protein [Candidatus Omnitrophica bacterium]|nr:prepilin-type N-terminal cleavage/methylation domain-containing protein [Candidatus Omnitrophota bacterium]
MMTSAINRTARSFTFVELLIVIAIIGILSAMVIPNLKVAQSNFELDSFVKDIYYLAKYLQVSAASRSRIYRLDIEQDSGKTYFSAKYKNNAAEFIPLSGRFKKIYTMPLSTEISSVEPPDRANIFFYPDASIDNTTIIFKNKSGKEMALVLSSTGTAIQIK